MRQFDGVAHRVLVLAARKSTAAEERRVAHDEVVPLSGLLRKILDGSVETSEVVSPRRVLHVLHRLVAGFLVNFYGVDGGVGGRPLRQHDGYEASAGANVKDTSGVRGVGPSAE